MQCLYDSVYYVQLIYMSDLVYKKCTTKRHYILGSGSLANQNNNYHFSANMQLSKLVGTILKSHNKED